MSDELEQDLFLEALENKTTITVVNQKVVIDPSLLEFNEMTLTPFIEKEAIWYNYYGKHLANAEAHLQFIKMQYDAIYASKFSGSKIEGHSDKMAEALAKASEEVQQAHKAIINAQRNVKLLAQHLRAWDKAHENAQSRGHMLRKEIDKLNAEISFGRNSSEPSGGYQPSSLADLGAEAEAIVSGSVE